MDPDEAAKLINRLVEWLIGSAARTLYLSTCTAARFDDLEQEKREEIATVAREALEERLRAEGYNLTERR